MKKLWFPRPKTSAPGVFRSEEATLRLSAGGQEMQGQLDLMAAEGQEIALKKQGENHVKPRETMPKTSQNGRKRAKTRGFC